MGGLKLKQLLLNANVIWAVSGAAFLRFYGNGRVQHLFRWRLETKTDGLVYLRSVVTY